MRKVERILLYFSHFQEFLLKTSSILLKFDKILKNSVVAFIYKDEQILSTIFI